MSQPPTGRDLAPRSIREGHAPNCSSAGSVVSLALLSTAATGVVVSVWADRLTRWLRRDRGPGEAPPPRVRDEGDTAVVAWPEPPAVLEVSTEAAAALTAAGATPVGGGSPVPGGQTAPTEVHLAVTDRCPAQCTGCYLSAGPDRPGTEPDDLHAQLAELAALGVFEVAFGGGEALLRDDLLALAAEARALGMVPNLTTSGFGVTPERAARMATLFGQVNVSLDGVGRHYTAARGWAGAERGLTALKTLAAGGVRCGVNTVLSKPLLDADGALDALGEQVAAAGAREWQWLRFKPVGRGAAAWASLAPTPEQLDETLPRALELGERLGLTVRIDCALVPFVAPVVDDPDRLRQLGVVGCPGGVGLWARSAAGAWAPCSFSSGQAAPESLAAHWRHEPSLSRWRDRASAPPEPCASCAVASVCRGGCRVVAGFLTGDELAADPQCPRVRGVC